MTDILSNPHVCAAVAFETAKDDLIGLLAEKVMSTKMWSGMTADERELCLRHIVSQVESEGELRERLTKIGLEDCAVSWYLSPPGDKIGDEARVLVRAVGGLVSKNGALVMLMTSEDMF